MHKRQMFQRIQILRFIAAFAVVAYHAQITIVSYFAGAKPYPLIENGAYGVDLFFVISGFIIVFISSTKESSAAVFAQRRAERIVPLYWLVTFGVFLLSYVPGLARGHLPSLTQLIKSLFFITWIDGPESYPVLNVGWTLEYEMFFYLLAGLSLAVTPRPWAATGFVMLALVGTGRGTTFFLQNPIIIEFVFGMIIAAFMYDRRLFYWLLPAAVVVLVSLPLTPATLRVWTFGVPSFFLVAGAVWLDLRKPYTGVVLPKLGDASYSIYLVHVLVISLACKIAVIIMPDLEPAVAIPVVALVATGAGVVVHQLVERNLMRVLSARRRGMVVALNP